MDKTLAKKLIFQKIFSFHLFRIKKIPSFHPLNPNTFIFHLKINFPRFLQHSTYPSSSRFRRMNRHVSAYEKKLLNFIRPLRAKRISCFSWIIFYYTFYNNSQKWKEFEVDSKAFNLYEKETEEKNYRRLLSNFPVSELLTFLAQEWNYLSHFYPYCSIAREHSTGG